LIKRVPHKGVKEAQKRKKKGIVTSMVGGNGCWAVAQSASGDGLPSTMPYCMYFRAQFCFL